MSTTLPPIILPPFQTPQITPDNILTVKFAQVVPSTGVPVPLVYVYFTNNSVTGYRLVNYNEWPYYYQLLALAAAKVGKQVEATKDGDNNVILSVGDAPPVDFNKPFSFTLNGNPFGAGENLSNVYNTTKTANDTVSGHFNVALISFNVPILTEGQKTFDEEYGNNYNFPHLATAGVGVWVVTYLLIVLDNTPVTIALTANSFQQINIDNPLTFGMILYGSGANPDTANGLLLSLNRTYVRTDTFFNFDFSGAQDGGLNWTQYNNGNSVETKINQAYNQQLNVVAGVNRIDFTKAIIQATQSGADFANDFFVSGNNPVAPYVSLKNPFANERFAKARQDSYVYCSGKNSTNGFIYMKRGGVILQADAMTADGNNHTVAVAAGHENYDELNFVPTAAAGILTSVILANALGGICSGTPVNKYTVTGTFGVGDVIYDDAALTTPTAGSLFVVNLSTGVAYHLNNVTGVVGAATATTCTPPTPRPIFFLNQTGLVLANFDINSPASVNGFAIGENKNINVSSEATITNNTGHTLTLNFYVSAPFIPGNLTPGSGSPNVIINGATYIFTNDISNYNYCVIS